MDRIRVIDTETTGLEPDAGVVEVGWTDVVLWNGKWMATVPHSRLVNPGRSIPPEAASVHHITDEMVKDEPGLSEVLSRWNILDPEIELFAAHRVAYDSQYIRIENPQGWLCTYKIAIRLAPGAAKHTNQFLRYRLNLVLDNPSLAEPPHRAGPDSYVTANLLARMLNAKPLDELISISNEPVVLPRFTFGEHAMKPMDEVPTSYLEWIMYKSKGDWDPDIKSTCEHHLKLRAAEGRDIPFEKVGD